MLLLASLYKVQELQCKSGLQLSLFVAPAATQHAVSLVARLKGRHFGAAESLLSMPELLPRECSWVVSLPLEPSGCNLRTV
jgi:hypothetical protein